MKSITGVLDEAVGVSLCVEILGKSMTHFLLLRVMEKY